MALFACSFDAVTPLAPWSSTAGVSIVAGRDANGCQLSNIGFSLLQVSGAFGATVTSGLAFNSQGFVNQVCILSDASGGVGAPFANIDNEGDGRMCLIIGASGLGSTRTDPFDGFVQNIGIWSYYEISVVITMVVTPVDGTHSDLSMTVEATLFVNNNQIGTVTDAWGASNILNVDLPAGIINDFQIRQNLAIVDDVYLNSTRIGDCFVDPDDTTVTVETAAPDVTQALFEIGLVDLAAAPDNTQSLYEVGLAPITLSIACPLGPLTAIVGVPFTSIAPGISGGTEPFTFVLISGPAWMTIDSATGVVSGIPDLPGTITYIIKVTDADDNTVTTDPGCSLTVSPAPAKAPTRCPLNFDQVDDISLACPIFGSPATIGVPYSKQMVVAGGLEPMTFLVTVGALPTGLGLDMSTGFITGTPTLLGTFNFTIQVIDSNAASDFVSCSILIIGSDPSILSVTCPLSGAANVGTAYSGVLTGSGGTGPYTFAIHSGALPAGLTLTTDTISGTPTVAGTYNYTVRITDSLLATSDSSCQIIVGPPITPPPPSPEAPTITTLTIPGGTVGFFYSFPLAASGDTPITWSATGVPAGMFLSVGGVLVGTPTGSGSFSVIVTAHNAVGNSAPVTFPLVIGAAGVAPVITSTSPLPDGSVGTPYSFTFTATGTAPINWSALIPSVGGWVFDPATATLSNSNPDAGVVTPAIQVRATNGAGDTGLISFDLTIQAVPVPPTPPVAP